MQSRRRLSLLVTRLAVVTLVAGAVACGAPQPSVVPVQVANPVAVDNRAELNGCMAAAGYTVHPGESGSNGVYSWERSSYYTWEPTNGPRNAAAADECDAKFAPKETTDAELRETYNRWLLERLCLIDLGFSPKQPPTFAKFREDWKTGPWSPIDGIPFDRITGDAKKRCGLEMVQ